MPTAFHNDPELKARLCARTLTAWQDGKLLPIGNLTWLPEQDHRGLMASLAETGESEVFTATTGLPVAPCLVFEHLIAESGIVARVEVGPSMSRNVYQCSDTTRAWPQRWLEAIRPGAELSSVLPRFTLELMTHLLGPNSVWSSDIDGTSRAAAQEVLSLWTRELAGETVDAKTWNAARKSAEAAAMTASDHWGELFVELYAQLAWPVEGLSEELPGILMPFIQYWVLRVVQPHLSDRIYSAMAAFAAGPRRRRALRADGVAPDGSSFDKLDPDSRQAVTFINSEEGQKLFKAGKQRAMAHAAEFLRPLLERFVVLTTQA